MGAEKGSTWARKELEYYTDLSFIMPNGAFNMKPNVQIITEHALSCGFVPNNQFQVINSEFVVFPKDYFCPKSYVDGEIHITENTHTIHHFAGSWRVDDKSMAKLKNLFGPIWGPRVYKLKNLLRKIIYRL